MDREIENMIQQKELLIISRPRFLFLKFLFLVFFVVIALRLVQIQLIDSPKYKNIAKKQYEKKFVLPATRGNIYDRNGNILVSNTMYISFAADPKIVGKNREAVAETFSHFFKKPVAFYLNKLREKSDEENEKRFVWLERRVDPEFARKIKVDKLPGVVVINEPKRLYHYDELASTLIGFTNVDNVGIAGVELQYNNDMKGVDGFVVMQKDGLGRVRPSIDYPRQDPIDGKDIYLTIDLTYQAVVEEELKRWVEYTNSDGGIVVMLNPKTGEVLALAVYPSVNPNEVGKFDVALSKNRAISDVFEPGSVFKLVTVSAALENQIVDLSTRLYAEHGKMKVLLNNDRFCFISDSKEFDYLTLQQAIEVSSNIVLAKVGKMIGPEKLYRQARAFGYGITTFIDLPGEVRGILKKPCDSEWSPTTIYAMSYGYEVGATPIQIACSYSAIANKGILMRPYVVSKIVSHDGKMVEQVPQAVRKVISQKTVEKITKALEGVVERGTGREVFMDGMRIAGKTGTARKYIDGKYLNNSYIASFVGFYPVEDPQVVCLVMLDNPRNGYYGGLTSGPAFRAIAERILTTSYKFSRKTIRQELLTGGQVAVPDVRMLHVSLAQKMLSTYGLTSQIFGKGNLVVKQSPEPGKRVEMNETVSLIVNDNSTPSEDIVIVPDVKGMSIRRAINRLAAEDFEVDIEGSGIVNEQFPNAGQRIAKGSKIKLICSQRSISQLSIN